MNWGEGFGLGSPGRGRAAPRLPPGRLPRHRFAAPLALFLAAVSAGCSSLAGGAAAVQDTGDARDPGATFPWRPPCVEAAPVAVLPDGVRESSGVVPASAGGFWTHNDSGWPAEIFRVGEDGSLQDQVRVEGARNLDWEDMAAGPCSGAGGRCLYLADTGDNREGREEVVLYRIPEPAPGDRATAPAARIRVRLPDGPRDIEAMALLGPGEAETGGPPAPTILLITKGRNHPVELYRVRGILHEQRAEGPGTRGSHPRGASQAPEPVEAERIQLLSSRPARMGELVVGGATGGSAAPLEEGGWLVALRDYERITFYRVVEGDTLAPLPGARVNLRPLREAQGEAVALAGGGRVILSSEGGLHGGPASVRVLDCSTGFRRWGVWPLPR